MIGLLMCTNLLFSCYVACNTNASVVCEIKFTYLLTYLLLTVIYFISLSFRLRSDTVIVESTCQLSLCYCYLLLLLIYLSLFATNNCSAAISLQK